MYIDARATAYIQGNRHAYLFILKACETVSRCIDRDAVFVIYLSHARIVQAAMIHSDMLNTSKTVPGQIVMRVFITNLKQKQTRKKHNPPTRAIPHSVFF